MKEFFKLVLSVALIVGGLAAVRAYEENPAAFEAHMQQFVDEIGDDHYNETFIDYESTAGYDTQNGRPDLSRYDR